MTVLRELWYLPRPARNHYKGGFPLFFEQRLFQMYRPQNILQPFGGGSLYGIKGDINGEIKPEIILDAHQLPFKDESFDFVLLDPPYSNDLSGKLYHTGKLKPSVFTNEAVRVCKTGGYVGQYGWLMPTRPKGTRFDRIIVIIGRARHSARICGVYQKVRMLL